MSWHTFGAVDAGANERRETYERMRFLTKDRYVQLEIAIISGSINEARPDDTLPRDNALRRLLYDAAQPAQFRTSIAVSGSEHDEIMRRKINGRRERSDGKISVALTYEGRRTIATASFIEATSSGRSVK